MIKIINGNILDAKEDYIGHQVNCHGVMGAGLAKQLRNKSKLVFSSYKSLCDRSDPRELLGTVQVVRVAENKYVANIFGQLNYGRSKLNTDYDALRKALVQLKTEAEYYDKSIALPYGIGCGLAGGDWDVVYRLIDEVFEDYDVTLYKFN